MKTISQIPQSVAFVYCGMVSSSSALHSNFANAILLTEDDIPGASLLGRKPEELKPDIFDCGLGTFAPIATVHL